MLATMALALATAASARNLAPRDECAAIAGAEAFRMALATAVANRDEAMLLPLFAPDVLLDFGGGSGRELLRERLNDPEYRLWEELDDLQRLGCAKGSDGGITMPWLWAQDLDEDDAFAVLYVTGANVPVYRGRTGDEVVTRLSWSLVGWSAFLDQEEEAEGATRGAVRLADGTTGYMCRHTVRSLLDFRLIVERMDDGQLLARAFVAGD
ncbi:hypothetical protein [Erythrobacter mangrovi]|uniref:Uncharacterized protein n=1 Tax=Erythrobacter mangrovi TaxID=2739433 RepID=A0A7D4B9I9_9SPHN|nr:hypothetical protein [Erythrobacter mangrovi]QKG70066.1 hypothetical protein HQR01_01025 [Erythrobacter mangrovi]